jgi:hypothetical protein
MALLIDKSLSANGGIQINQIYLRLRYSADLTGKNLYCRLFPYYDKNSFLSNWQHNVLSIENLNTSYSFSYDSSSNGDPLTYIHEKVKEKLSSDIYRLQRSIDPSTGIPVIDPSTNQPVYEQIIITPRFAEESEISLVDLN